MKTWQPLNPRTPSALTILATATSSAGAVLENTLDTVETGLGVAGALLQSTANPAANAANALLTQTRAFADALLNPRVYHLALHPWTPGVGDREGAFKSLPHPVLRQVLSDSLVDTGDDQRPKQGVNSPLEMLCITLGAASPALFASSLETLNALLGLSQFAMAVRRVKQAFTLTEKRYIQPQRASRPPNWQQARLAQALPALERVSQSLQGPLNLANSTTVGTQDSIAVFQALVASKRRQVGLLHSRLEEASQLFTGGVLGAGAYVLHAKDLAGAQGLRDALLHSKGAPQTEQAFCAAVCLVASSGVLTPLAKVFV